jgi:hypothetical protein
MQGAGGRRQDAERRTPDSELRTQDSGLRTYPPWDGLAPYAGRWVALVRGHVAGVGRTAEEALWVARLNRPRDKPELLFVPPGEKSEADVEDQNP